MYLLSMETIKPYSFVSFLFQLLIAECGEVLCLR